MTVTGRRPLRNKAKRTFLSLAVAGALAAVTAAHAQPKAPDGPGEIFTQGEFFVGCNYWARHAGMYMWSNWRPDVVERELSELAKYGVRVLRVFPLWPDFQPLTGNCRAGGAYKGFLQNNGPLQNHAAVDEEMMRRFRFFCDVAQKNDIKLIVGIITGWMSGRQFVPNVFEEKNVLVDPEAVMWETRFTKYFVEQLKDHPAIAAWDYGNECNCMGAQTAGQAAFYNWMDHIGMAIRSKDLTRPVVSGMHGLSTEENHPQNVRQNGEIADILCTHPYALYVAGCGKEAFNTMRTALHPTAESLLYRDLGGKPCFVEEVGNLGNEFVSEARTASGLRTTMFSAWANDLKGVLWWCNSDQEGLDFPPYNLTACERELGLLRDDYSPKPVMLEMKKFQDFRATLPFKKLPLRKPNAVIVVPEKVAGWTQGFGCYLMARQAGLDPNFAGAEVGELPESDLYIVASVDRDQGYSYPAQKKFFAKAYEGATVMVIVGGSARYTHFRQMTGLEVDYGARSQIDRTFVLDGTPVSCRDDFTMKVIARECEVLVKAQADGEPVFTRFKYGKGNVLVVNSPVDRAAINRSDCFAGKRIAPFYRLFREAAKIAGIKTKIVKGDCPYVCFTEHPAKDGSTVVMAINFEPRAIDCPISIAGRLGKVWRGKVTESSVSLEPNEAALFEVK